MYIADLGIFKPPGTNIGAAPNTGVIWIVTRL